MKAAKISVSLSGDTARFVERYRKTRALKTRSEVIERALSLLRKSDLRQAYKEAAEEDRKYGYSKDWDCTVADGLEDESW